jgi:hypothetical protein
MNVIYLRDNHKFYQNSLHKNKFATVFYEFNFVIKIISLCLDGFFILFSYINLQSINKKIIYFFYIDNIINNIIYVVNVKMNLYLQIFIYLIIFVLQRINIFMCEEKTPSLRPIDSPPLESTILSENEEDPKIDQKGYNFEDNGYNNNCYSDNRYYNAYDEGL